MEKGGEIIFETGVDTKGLEQGLSEIKHETENLDDIVIDVDDDEILEGMSDRLQELHKELKELQGKHVIGDDERQRMKEIKDEITQIIDKANEMTGQNYVFKGITDVKDQTSSLEKSVKSISKGIDGIGKKMLKVGLAMLGIQSVMGLFKQSFSRVAEGNPQMQGALDHVKGAIDVIVQRLITIIEPFIPKLIPLIDKVAAMVLKICDILFNKMGPIIEGLIKLASYLVDLLADAVYYLSFGLIDFRVTNKEINDVSLGAEKFANNMKNANKSVSKLRKQLMGFDEMNILNKDTGTTGALGSIIGSSISSSKSTPKSTTPTTSDYKDFNEMFEATDYWETANAFEQLVNDAIYFGRISEKNGIVSIFSATGNEIRLTKEEYDNLVNDISFKVISPKNFKTWQKVKDTFQGWNVNQFKKKFNSAVNLAKNGLKDATVTYENGMVKVRLATGETFTFTKEQWEKINQEAKINANGTKTSWIQAGNNIISKFTSDDKVGGVKGALLNAFWEIQNGGDTSSDETKTSWVQAGADIISKFTGEDGVEGAVTGAFDNLPESAETNTNEAIGAVKGGVDQYNKNPSKAKVEVQQDSKQNTTTVTNDIKNKTKNPFKATVQAVLDTTGMMKTLKAFAKSWPLAFQPIVNALQKQGYYAKGAILSFAKGGIINAPRLASGGIINRPGKGVPLAVGGAIGGERGREAVVPLTDTQQMQYLGREIAKYLVVNLTNVTELDGRVLARSVSQVMNDMNFASNGGVI